MGDREDSIVYRTAREDEIPVLAGMRWDFWVEGGHDPASYDHASYVREATEIMRLAIAVRELTCWIAESSGEIVAQMCVRTIHKVPKPNKLHDSFGYVSNVYTRPAYRNRGIGTQLMAHVKAWALEQDFEFLVLWPSEESVRFYERAGFTGTEGVVYEVRPYAG